MIEATKGPTLPKQTLRDWVLQQRRSARSTEAVDRFSEVLKVLDTLTQNKPVRSVTVENPLPPPPGATPDLETVASAKAVNVKGYPMTGDAGPPIPPVGGIYNPWDAAGETDQVRPRKARKSWTRRNVIDAIKPNVTRKASRSVKRSATTDERNQRDAPAKAAKKARKGGRPQQGPAPMTPAERVKAYRERKRAEAAAKGTGGKRGRRGSKDR